MAGQGLELMESRGARRTALVPFLCGSPAMLRVLEALDRVSATDARVILYGEPGVGKTHAARRLHASSARRSRPMARLSARDLRALDRLLDRAFLNELAGATLLLEGVDEAPAEVQSVLVGLIEEWDLPEESKELPVRILSTAEKDLFGCVEAGAFRRDLCYLLDVFPLAIPALRERAEEIPLFLEHFFRKHSRDASPPPVPEEFLAEALGYAWPGNLRELENVVVGALPAHAGGSWTFPRVLPRRGSFSGALAFCDAKREFERGYIRRILTLTGGNVSRAALIAEKARKDFYALMARNQVDPAEFRPR
jgi:two-component system response regulator GlrR